MEVTTAVWRAEMPVFFGTGDKSRSGARNHAIRQAVDAGAECLFVVDADTEVSMEQVEAAVEAAMVSGVPVFPYDEFLRVRRARTESLLARERNTNWHRQAAIGARPLILPPLGAMVIPASVLETVGGYDARFTAWGCEDRCFLLAVETLVGRVERIPGPAFHWWHPVGPDRMTHRNSKYDAVRKIARRYVAAAGYPDVGWPLVKWPHGAEPESPDREAMLAVLSEHGGPLSRP